MIFDGAASKDVASVYVCTTDMCTFNKCTLLLSASVQTNLGDSGQ